MTGVGRHPHHLSAGRIAAQSALSGAGEHVCAGEPDHHLAHHAPAGAGRARPRAGAGSAAGGSLSTPAGTRRPGAGIRNTRSSMAAAAPAPKDDGVSAQDELVVNVMNTPVESLESEFPVRVERYELAQDFGGRREIPRRARHAPPVADPGRGIGRSICAPTASNIPRPASSAPSPRGLRAPSSIRERRRSGLLPRKSRRAAEARRCLALSIGRRRRLGRSLGARSGTGRSRRALRLCLARGGAERLRRRPRSRRFQRRWRGDPAAASEQDRDTDGRMKPWQETTASI